MNGKQQKELGIQKASDSAERKQLGWNQSAHETLCEFLKRRKKPFLTEEFREYAKKKGLPTPNSLRAFGGVMLGAARRNMIKQIDIVKVSNPRAHQANAALWRVC